MKILGVIPARYASSRFPGKPLINIDGKTMLQRVYEQVKKSTLLNDVIIATDDDRIFKHAQEIGATVVMTSPQHQSGTDRCAEALNHVNEHYDVVINIQGDEPFIHPEQIDLLCSCFENDQTEIATLVKKISNAQDLLSNTIMKVVFTQKFKALYFSRNSIPHVRGKSIENWLEYHTYYKHIGIYGFKKNTLKAISQLTPSPLELAESLEQLRWLENDFNIHVAITELESVSIDTPQDLEKIKSLT